MPDTIKPAGEFYREVMHGRTDIHPQHWPADVNIISVEGLSLLGKDLKGNLYLDGRRLYTEARFNWVERLLASALALAAIVGAVAASVSAYVDIEQLSASSRQDASASQVQP